MEPSFWQARWREQQIAFHEGKPNALLMSHTGVLEGCHRILVPLAGKTEDVAFLANAGHAVLAVELVEDAVRAFFDEHGLRPEITEAGALKRFRVAHDDSTGRGNIDYLAGDFFATTRDLCGPLDALYDRAALVALPPALRDRYVAHLDALLPATAKGLVISLEYDESEKGGPPHAVPPDEMERHFGGRGLRLLGEGDGLEERHRKAGITWMREKVWAF